MPHFFFARGSRGMKILLQWRLRGSLGDRVTNGIWGGTAETALPMK
jgi:hypothetical protein